MAGWIQPETFYAQLPSFYIATAALITETGSARVLLVKDPNREYWQFPGGYLDDDEYPHAGCERELLEELGLKRTPTRLLVLDFASAKPPRPKPIISMVFDCGCLPQSAPITLASDELEAWEFLTPEEAVTRLPESVAHRVPAALHARATGATVTLADGLPWGAYTEQMPLAP